MLREHLFAALDSGATVLTANNRVARSLRHAYAARQRESGFAAWRSADILPWTAWLRRAWEDALYSGQAPARMLLNPEQELALWERVIAGDPQYHPLLQLAATARQAGAAWELAYAWKLELGGADWQGIDDAEAFLRWAAAFRARCDQEGWLDGARLVEQVAAGVRAGTPRPPHRVLLVGFDEFTPRQEDLWDALRAAGCSVQTADEPARGGRAVLASLPGGEEEIRAAARWARHLVEQGAGRVGVIVPNLARVRAAADRLFREVMYPGQAMPDPRASCFNISFGVPLVDYPLVATALRILELDPEAAPVEAAGRLLRSPFLAGAAQEGSARALLAAELARRGDPEADLETIEKLARREKPYGCPRAAAALETFRRMRRGVPKWQAPSAWAAAIPELLRALGWPGDRPLDSVEYQTLARWQELLGTLAALDGVSGAMSLEEAARRLRRMAAESQFQPLQQDAPVQVLGVFEASGMRFDHLWIMGMHDEAWPEAPAPNPFLPAALQRRRQLPHASAERELAFARRVTERLLASAPRVVVSWPRREGDRDLRPSPLVSHLPAVMAELLEMWPGESYAARVRAAGEVECISDGVAPPLAGELAMRGGARLYQLQAACPFRAFAELRLGAAAPEYPQAGLDPRQRGTLMHAALDRLWGVLGSHARLMEMSAAAVRGAVRDAVAGAIEQKCAERRLPARFLEIEQARLEGLLAEWLELEKLRQPFTVVAREERDEVSLGGLTVRVKVDRIDELADGSRVILDYKSGDPNERDWQTDRPAEPQVPLYAIRGRGPLGAAAFARVRNGGSGFRGIAAAEGILPRVKAAERPLAEQVEEWRRVLARLAEEFREGDARVDPRDGPKTCETCHLAPLCRIREAEADQWA
ncbi:MAG TPA: PD-(D/E)XK nuclease family protein [Bryobacteraceae bacterium]|nr:PD-(D/E)XK nuclease family protein [Bryobacteraceae bacterium]